MSGPSRRAVLGAVPGLASAVALPTVGGAAASPTNVLCVVVDALPAAVVGPHPRDPDGRLAGCMPRLRRLATEGFVLRSAIAAHAQTAPALAALWTGRPGSETGAMRRGLLPDPELPVLLDHIAGQPSLDVLTAGRVGLVGRRGATGVTRLLSDMGVAEGGNDAVVDVFTAAMANQPPGRPWLGVVGLRGLSVLEPVARRLRGLDRAPDLGLPDRSLPPSPDPTLPDAEATRIGRDLRAGTLSADAPPGLWRHLAWLAERQLVALDRQLGTLVDGLAGTVHAGRTTVIVTAATGHPVGRHALAVSGAPYAHTLEVPCVVWGGDSGGSDALVSGLDLAPTVCDLLGVPQLPGARGYSMRPLVEQTAGTWRRSVVAEAHIDARAMRTSEFWYVRYPGPEEHLFHARNDVPQLRNLVADTGYQSTVHDLRTRLAEHASTLTPCAAAEAGWPGDP